MNNKYVLHNASIDFPFPFKEGGTNGEVLHYAHENGCSTYLLFKSGPQMKIIQYLTNICKGIHNKRFNKIVDTSSGD